MSAQITNLEERRRVVSEVIRVSRGILDGSIGIVAGARALARLRFDARAEDDRDFLVFTGIDSESDHLPIGDIRRQWSADALRAKDDELQRYEAWMRDRAFRACQSLIERYEHEA